MALISIVISADPNTSLSTIRAAASGAVRRINNDSPLVAAGLVSADYVVEPEAEVVVEEPKPKAKSKAKSKPAE